MALADNEGGLWRICSSDTLYVHEKMVKMVRWAVDEKTFSYNCYEVNARRFPKGAAEEVAQINVDLLNHNTEIQE